MNYDDFEASVGRKSAKERYCFFVNFLLKNGQRYTAGYEATADELASCLTNYRAIKAQSIKEIVQAYCQACELNSKESFSAFASYIESDERRKRGEKDA